MNFVRVSLGLVSVQYGAAVLSRSQGQGIPEAAQSMEHKLSNAMQWAEGKLEGAVHLGHWKTHQAQEDAIAAAKAKAKAKSAVAQKQRIRRRAEAEKEAEQKQQKDHGNYLDTDSKARQDQAVQITTAKSVNADMMAKATSVISAPSFERLANTNCFMHDLSFTLDVEDAEACEQICAGNQACAAYVYCYGEYCTNGPQTCWEKDSTAVDCLRTTAGHFPGRDAGIRAQNGFASLANTDCEGHNLWATGNVESVGECEALCADDDSCAAYVWCFDDSCGEDQYKCFEKDSGAVDCLMKNVGSVDGRDAGVKSVAPGVPSLDDES